jgi:hypothetical protein
MTTSTPASTTPTPASTTPGVADAAGVGASPEAAEESQLRLPAGRRPVPTGTRLTTRRLPVLAYALSGLLLLGGTVGGSMALGWWQTDCGGVNETAVATGTLTPDGVKGSMTVQQVADGFPSLTTADVLTFFAVPADTPASTQLKTLVQNGSTMDVTDFRAWLAQRPTP